MGAKSYKPKEAIARQKKESVKVRRRQHAFWPSRREAGVEQPLLASRCLARDRTPKYYPVNGNGLLHVSPNTNAQGPTGDGSLHVGHEMCAKNTLAGMVGWWDGFAKSRKGIIPVGCWLCWPNLFRASRLSQRAKANFSPSETNKGRYQFYPKLATCRQTGEEERAYPVLQGFKSAKREGMGGLPASYLGGLVR